MPPPAPEFADATGRPWPVRLTVGLQGQIKDRTGIDLFAALWCGNAFANVFVNPPDVVAEALFIAVGGPGRVAFDDFARALDGDALRAGVAALLLAAANLYPHGAIVGRLRVNVRREVDAIGDRIDQVMVNAFRDVGVHPNQ